MNRTTTYCVAFLIGIGCTVVILEVANRGHRRGPATVAATNAGPKRVTTEPTSVAVAPETEKVTQEVEPVPTPVVTTETQVKPASQANSRTLIVPQRPGLTALDPLFKEQLGRYALSFVGLDPMADEVWSALIYDSSLPEKVREDLMEDLNENGFSGGDGRVPTSDDLMLIETRISLVEEHMREADEFMMEHLAEARKDLVNMWYKLKQ